MRVRLRLVPPAKHLRRVQTEAERKLWSRLRSGVCMTRSFAGNIPWDILSSISVVPSASLWSRLTVEFIGKRTCKIVREIRFL